MPKLPEKIPPKFVATPLVCRDCRAEGICSIVQLDGGRLVSLCWDCADDRHQARNADERAAA